MLHHRLLAASAFSLVFLAGCTEDTDTDTDTDVSCTNSVTPYPEDGETAAYYRGTVEAKLATADTTATITLADGAGAAIAGSSVVNDKIVVFTPSAPLTASTAYTATISHACGEATWSFTTSMIGGAVTDDLVGNTYALDLQSGRFVQPAGIGDLVAEYLTTDILIGVSSVGNGKINMVGAVGVEGANPPEQDVCNPTIPFPEADFNEDPYFEIDATGSATPISVAGYTVNIDDLQLSGAFAPDGSYIDGAHLAGGLDTYPLAILVDEACVEGGADWPDCQEAVCDLAAVIGGCVECGDGSGKHCLFLDVDSIGAAGIDGTLEQMDEEDVCANHAAECPDDCEAPPM